MTANEIAQRLMGMTDVAGDIPVQIRVVRNGKDNEYVEIVGFDYDPEGDGENPTGFMEIIVEGTE